MPIQIACPHCDTSYRLPDDKLGKRVRCKQCQESFTVTSKAGKSDARFNGGAGDDKDDMADKVLQRKVNVKKADDDERDSSDTKSRRKVKNPSMLMVWIGAGGAALALIAAGAWFVTSTDPSGGTADAPKQRKKKDAQVVSKDAGSADQKPKDGPGDSKGAKTDPKEPISEDYALAENDPIRVHYEKLLLDRRRYLTEVNSAVEFFLRTDPRLERDVQGLLFGFKDHPWRGKIAKKLELLIDLEDFAKSKLYWQAYCSWAVAGDVPQLMLHMQRAGEHRAMVLERIADFKTPQAAQFVVAQLTSSEQALAVRLIRDLGGRLCLDAVFPYLWHPDPQIIKIADTLVKGFDMDVQHPFYKGPSKEYPRVPAPQEQLTLDSAVKILVTPPPPSGNWQSPERFRLLMTLGWLDTQPLSKAHEDSISKALDGMILLKDYPLSTNALFCLGRWGTEHNLGTLKKLYDTDAGANKKFVVNLMKRIPAAQRMLVFMWPGMDLPMQMAMIDFMLALNNDDAKLALMSYLNHKLPHLQQTAREAAKKWRIDPEILIDQCMKDINNPDTQISALRWLKEQRPPKDEKKRQIYLERIALLAKPHPDKKKAAEPHQMMLVFEAQAVWQRWAADPNRTKK